MINEKKAKQYAVMGFAVWLLLLIGALWSEGVFAHGGHHNVTNNYYVTEVTEVNEIANWRVSGLSDSQLVELTSSTLAGGSHQFSPLTTRVQLSITGATTTTDWDEDTEFSFAAAWKPGKEHWLPNALYHVEYTPDVLGYDYIHFGGTILLGGPQ